MAVELGFRTNAPSPLTSVQNVGYDNTTGNLWDTDTPGKTIFGWEEKYQIIDPNTLLPTGTLAAEGIEVFCGRVARFADAHEQCQSALKRRQQSSNDCGHDRRRLPTGKR